MSQMELVSNHLVKLFFPMEMSQVITFNIAFIAGFFSKNSELVMLSTVISVIIFGEFDVSFLGYGSS